MMMIHRTPARVVHIHRHLQQQQQPSTCAMVQALLAPAVRTPLKLQQQQRQPWTQTALKAILVPVLSTCLKLPETPSAPGAAALSTGQTSLILAAAGSGSHAQPPVSTSGDQVRHLMQKFCAKLTFLASDALSCRILMLGPAYRCLTSLSSVVLIP